MGAYQINFSHSSRQRQNLFFFPRRYSLRMKVLSEGFYKATTVVRREKPPIGIYRVFPAILHVFRFCTTYPQLRCFSKSGARTKELVPRRSVKLFVFIVGQPL